MSSKFSFGKVEFGVALGGAPSPQQRRTEEDPFCLAVLGDFSGRSSRSILEPLAQRHFWPLDCDNFEQVMARLEARVRLPDPHASGEPLELRFTRLEDFHPDQILPRVPTLATWLEQRRQLLNPAPATPAADDLQTLLKQPGAPAPTDAESHEDTLARLLGDKPRPAAQPALAASGLDISRLLQNIVGSSAAPATSPQQTALRSALDIGLGSQLRAILHDPAFQALEAAWRGVDRLVREFGGEDNVKLCLVDVSKEELAADLKAQDELSSTGFCRLLRRAAEDRPWAVLLGCYVFDADLKDIQTLGRISRLSAWSGAPFLAAASPNLVGCDSFGTHPDTEDWIRALPADVGEAWNALRALPEAACLGLALPRFLMRQPYGRDSDPIEAFPFEELPPDLAHEAYLWGNPAFLCAHVLADAFRADGWAMQAGGYAEVSDLPVPRFTREGETQVKPCAEAWLSDRVSDAIAERGLIPVQSIKGRDAVRLASVQSVRNPPTALAGRWQ